jgi:hypothetical protein
MREHYQSAQPRMGTNWLLAGLHFGEFPFVLSILPEPIYATNGAALMRRNIKHGFQTHDDKGRLVTSHIVNFTYPLD